MALLAPERIPTRLVAPGEKRQVGVAAVKVPSRFTSILILIAFVRWISVVAWLRILGRLTRAEHARRLREFLEMMGGLWIKAGQLLSLRRDTFSPELCDELSKLLDQTTAFPTADARAIVEAELGVPIEAVFDEFSPVPFAAASIGQLHMARLRRENIWVAVKVQRPHIEAIFRHQLVLIRMIAYVIDRFLIPHLRANDVVNELVYVMREEVDYRMEASNIRRMRKTLKRHKIYAPKVFSAHTTRRVLVMEYIQGVLMSDYINVLLSDPQRISQWHAENNFDPHLAARRLQSSLLRQILEDNLFHGDLHPGNVVLLRNSGLALLDFGSVGFMDSEYLRKYSMFLRCLAEREHSKAVDVMILLSSALPPIDLQDAKEQLIRIFRAWETRTVTPDLPYHQKSLSSLNQEAVKILNEYRIPATWMFLKLIRANVTLDASLMHLYPDMNYPKLIRWYFRRAERRELSRVAQQQLSSQGLIGLSSMLSVMPELVYEYRMFQAPVLRQHAQLYRGDVSKIHYILAIFFRDAARAVLAASVYLTAIFLEQQHPNLIEPVLGTTLRGSAQVFPSLPYYGWLSVLILMFYAYRNLNKIRHRMARREVRRAQAP